MYSKANNSVINIGKTRTSITGLAWDPISQLLYYSTWQRIFRTKLDGSGAENVFMDRQLCKLLCETLKTNSFL